MPQYPIPPRPFLYSTISQYALYRLNEGSSPRRRGSVKTELYERTRLVLRDLLPHDVELVMWIWIERFMARVVGDAAVWVCSARRMWKPRSFQLMVPYNKWADMLRSMDKVLDADWTLSYVPTDTFPLSPICASLKSRKGQCIEIYRANPVSMDVTIGSSPLTHLQSWFDGENVCNMHARLGHKQQTFLLNDSLGPTHREIVFWRSNGWEIYDGKNLLVRTDRAHVALGGTFQEFGHL